MRWLCTFRGSSAVQWALLTAIVGMLVVAAIPVFERVMQFADDVAFRYTVNAFKGSVKNAQMRLTFNIDNKQSDTFIIDGVEMRFTPSKEGDLGFPFALAVGAKTLAVISPRDCGDLLSLFTDQSYWLADEHRVEAFSQPQPKFRAEVGFDNSTLFCRFEKPVRTGFWGNEASSLARHVFAYYPASGRVEVLRETGEVK